MQKILIISSFFFLYLQTWSQFFPIPNGWIDATGKEYLCNECDSTYYSDHDFVVFKKGNYFRFKNIITNQEFPDLKFQYLSSFSDGFAVAKMNNQFQFSYSLDIIAERFYHNFRLRFFTLIKDSQWTVLLLI